MLSSVLSSKKAIQINIQIMRVFTRIRKMLLTKEALRNKLEDLTQKVDENFLIVFSEIDRLNRLLEPEKPTKKQIGFKIK